MVRIGKLLPIRIPKVVAIRNGKLSVLQLVVQITVVSLLLYQFVEERMYLVVKIPQGFPNAWVQVSSASANAVTRDYGGQICNGNNEYLYKYSASWIHGKYQCLETSSAEAGYKIGKREIYFPTYFRETHGRTSSGSDCASLCPGAVPCSDSSLDAAPGFNFGVECSNEKIAGNMPVLNPGNNTFSTQAVRTCTCETQAHYLVAGVSSKAMGFEHIFKVSGASDAEVSGSSGITKANAEADENKLPVVTVIMQKQADGTFKEFDCYDEKKSRDPSISSGLRNKCRFSETPSGAPDDVWMTLQDWVTAASAGSVDLSDPDARNPDIASNLVPGYDTGAKRMAPYRLTGLEVVISIEYVAPAFQHKIPESVDLAGFEDYMVALVKLSVNQAMWTGLPHVAYGSPAVSAIHPVTPPYAANTSTAVAFNQGSWRERYHYGIRFLFMTSTSSAYGAFSLMDLLTGLAVFKVYFGAAGALIALFALSCLGSLSVQYKRGTETPLDLHGFEAKRVAPARILVAISAFHGLCRVLEDTAPEAVTAADGGRKIIDGSKVSMLTLQKCFETVFGDGHIQLGGGGIAALSRSVLETLGDGNYLDVEKFVNAYTACDCIDLEQMQVLYDENRPVGRLERYFSSPLDLGNCCSSKVGAEA